MTYSTCCGLTFGFMECMYVCTLITMISYFSVQCTSCLTSYKAAVRKETACACVLGTIVNACTLAVHTTVCNT